jgi:hypothetical protein
LNPQKLLPSLHQLQEVTPPPLRTASYSAKLLVQGACNLTEKEYVAP